MPSHRLVPSAPLPFTIYNSPFDRFTMIWDLHCHLSGVEGRTPDERMAQMIEYADRMGIERLVVFMGQQFLSDPTPEQFRRNHEVTEIGPRGPRDVRITRPVFRLGISQF